MRKEKEGEIDKNILVLKVAVIHQWLIRKNTPSRISVYFSPIFFRYFAHTRARAQIHRQSRPQLRRAILEIV